MAVTSGLQESAQRDQGESQTPTDGRSELKVGYYSSVDLQTITNST